MHITKQQLNKIVKQELSRVLNERRLSEADIEVNPGRRPGIESYGGPYRTGYGQHSGAATSAEDLKKYPSARTKVHDPHGGPGGDFDPHQTDPRGKYQALAAAAVAHLKPGATTADKLKAEAAEMSLVMRAEQDPDAQAMLDAVEDAKRQAADPVGSASGAELDIMGGLGEVPEYTEDEAEELQAHGYGGRVQEGIKVTKRMIKYLVREEVRNQLRSTIY